MLRLKRVVGVRLKAARRGNRLPLVRPGRSALLKNTRGGRPVFAGLKPETTYYVRVSASNDQGQSGTERNTG